MVRNITGLLGSGSSQDKNKKEQEPDRETCIACDASLVSSSLFASHRLCQTCRFHYSLTARERIDSLADPNTFQELNPRLTSLDPLSFSTRISYKQRILNDQRRTGLTEAVVSGRCDIGGSPVVLVVMDFGFMGGSMGCVVGEKIALAIEHAAKRKSPIVTIVTSGGARFQEGVLSLMQMAKTSMATGQLEAKGLPFISVLANPAVGQAYASFANLADIILAEPGAIIGLTPMRVIRETSGQPVPGGSLTSEWHLEHGMIDAIVDREELREHLAILLDLLASKYQLTTRQKTKKTESVKPRLQAWDSVQLARHETRPTSAHYIESIVDNFVELHGDRSYGDDPALICGIGHLGGQTVFVIGQERGMGEKKNDRNGGMIAPEGFRKARRVMLLASKFNIPLITLVDTPGPLRSLGAEERGMGNAIAVTMASMSALKTPTIAIVIGEGGSEGALALAVASRVLMQENAIYSIISPEDAAGLIYQDEEKAEEVAESLKLTAQDCKELSIVDVIVQEPIGGAHTNANEAARQLRRAVLQSLAELQSLSEKKLLSQRYKKFRKMGEYGSYFKMAITKEVEALQGLVAQRVRRITRRMPEKTKESDPVSLEEGK